MFWKNETITFNLFSFSHNHNCGEVVGRDNVLWWFIGIYGWPEEENKHNKAWFLIGSLCEGFPIVIGAT